MSVASLTVRCTALCIAVAVLSSAAHAQVLSSPIAAPTVVAKVRPAPVAVSALPRGAAPVTLVTGAPPGIPTGQGAGVHGVDIPFPNLVALADRVPRSTLTDVKTKNEKNRSLPIFTPSQMVLHNKTQRVQGFMSPLTCSFCTPPGGPESRVEVEIKIPVKHSIEPVTVEGRFLVLNVDSFGLYYRMTDPTSVKQSVADKLSEARFVTPSIPPCIGMICCVQPYLRGCGRMRADRCGVCGPVNGPVAVANVWPGSQHPTPRRRAWCGGHGRERRCRCALSVNLRIKYAVGRCPLFSSHLWAHEDNGYVHQFKHFTGWSSTGSTYGQEQGNLNPADANGDGVDDNAPDDAILSEFAYRTVRARFVGLKASGNIRLLQGR